MNPMFRLLVLVFSALSVSGCFGPKTPQEVTQAFWQGVLEDDVSHVVEYSTLTTPDAYDAFSKDWQGYEPEWGRVVIDGDEATVVSGFKRPDSEGDHPRRFETHLVKQDDQWRVDYAKTAQAIRGDVFTQLLGKLDRFQSEFSRQFDESSRRFQAEMDRLSDEMEAYSESLGRHADETLEEYGEALQDLIREMEESVRDALSDKKRELSKQDRRTLEEVADDLERSGDELSDPDFENIVESGRTVGQSRTRLDSTAEETTGEYRKQWDEWAREFEKEFHGMLDELANSLNQ